ncbi:hypothetical protein X275_02055 [Marinitoga sp. 1197]|uniref:hypothetical protein n=1 Tax=Marinitoga sp. 1197 TaxID=1428449 RepID=UPI00064123B7|nr:hypothetical protein [Marinitoga sp. 1197]KLO23632.1 hypothetical protein X275_02055 [Marinitoga sp. 1197]
MKLLYKYMLYFFIVGLIPLIIIFGVIRIENRKMVNFTLEDEKNRIKNSVNKFFGNKFEELLQIAYKYSNNNNIKKGLLTNNREYVKKY